MIPFSKVAWPDIHVAIASIHYGCACPSTFLKRIIRYIYNTKVLSTAEVDEIFFMLFLKANYILSGSFKYKYEDNQTMHTTLEFTCKLTSHV